MIHIAICDNEQTMSDNIRDMVCNFFREKHTDILVSQFASGEELLRHNGRTDILFLDIQMGKVDGMETARILRSRDFKGILIFITVLREMVFDAFAVQAYDYLVKPIQKKEFFRTMERLFLTMQNAADSSLLIRKKNESRIISFDDIIFCEIIDRKVHLHLTSSEIVTYYEKIENLEQLLDSRFYRCHRSYLIHLKYLKSYKNGTACMMDGAEIPVSRLRSREFSDVVLQYMKKWRG